LSAFPEDAGSRSESALDALSVQLSADELEELAQLTEPSRTYWSKRQSMPWG
jgi:diketogulonate reductase-like aldo/keto reductase